MKPAETTPTPRYFYVAADGSWGDATDLKLIRQDSSMLLSLSEDPTDAEMRELAEEIGLDALPVGIEKAIAWYRHRQSQGYESVEIHALIRKLQELAQD